MSYLHKNIQFLRKHNKIGAEKFVEMTGLSALLVLIENGNTTPGPDEMVRISEVFHIPLDTLIKVDLAARYKKIKNLKPALLALDVDGVLTDGGMFYTQQGDEFKKFNAKDGLAIKTLTSSNFPVAFISSGINDRIITERAKLLGVQHVYVGTWKKLEVLEKWCTELGIALQNVAYIGDDVNDLPVMTAVGLSACPADAVAKVRNAAAVILKNKGGKGCVREFVEEFIMAVECSETL
jgi:3-deoxy-D-manno-octulosonate 8-phosphate phosphatase (KDO 8-P phosphatase)